VELHDVLLTHVLGPIVFVLLVVRSNVVRPQPQPTTIRSVKVWSGQNIWSPHNFLLRQGTHQSKNWRDLAERVPDSRAAFLRF
jgi:hypothetical protein